MAEPRSFRGRTIAEVMERVRGDLGPEAMILSTRKRQGRDGLFEITALPAGHDKPVAGPEVLGELKSELMSLREMILLLNHSGGMVERLLTNPGLLSLYAALIRNGVNADSARALLEKGGALGNGSGGSASTVKKRVLREIAGAMEVKDPFEAAQGGPVIAAFLGTTGVGKTTTVAKLAAQLMLRGKKKVGLVSIDGYRIGAMEQLRIYANILGIPCFPAFCRKDLLYALRKLSGRDVVLIDTAGQSHYDRERINALRGLIPAEAPVDCHLLLPVGTSDGEMDQAARSFKAFGFKSYIFTKLDECQKRGSMLNQLLRLPLPVSYVTTGQNVPEDIEKADRGKLLNLILNGN
jgi:flagellar biosynthesis protein FlhF